MQNILVLFTSLLLLAGCAPRVATNLILSAPDAAPVALPREVPPAFVEMVALVNEVRGRGYGCGGGGRFGPAVPLAWNLALAEAAENHSRDMAVHGFFSHTGSDSTDVSARVERHGSPGRRSGKI